MGIEISGFNLGAVAPQSMMLLAAIAVILVDVCTPAGRRRPLALLSLAGVILTGGVSFAIWEGGGNSVFQDMAVADGFSIF